VSTPGGTADTSCPRPAERIRPHRPPPAELLVDCVHCGFCLPTCRPTSCGARRWTPRAAGIYLMDLASKARSGWPGRCTSTSTRASAAWPVVTACPSGVQYDGCWSRCARSWSATSRAPGATAVPGRLFALFPYRGRLRAAALPGALYQRCAGAGGGAARRAAGRGGSRRWSRCCRGRLREAFARLPERSRRGDAPRRSRCSPAGCQDVFFHECERGHRPGAAAEGCEVLFPRTSAAAGRWSCTPAANQRAGSGAAARSSGSRSSGWPSWTRWSQRGGLRLVDEGVRPPARRRPGVADRAAAFSAKSGTCTGARRPDPGRAPPPRPRPGVYHDACTSGSPRASGRSRARCCARSPDLELVEVPEAELCCGSAGIYNLVAPEAAAELGAREGRQRRSASPDLVVTANPGCLLQIRKHLGGGAAGSDLPLMHPVQRWTPRFGACRSAATSLSGRRSRVIESQLGPTRSPTRAGRRPVFGEFAEKRTFDSRCDFFGKLASPGLPCAARTQDHGDPPPAPAQDWAKWSAGGAVVGRPSTVTPLPSATVRSPRSPRAARRRREGRRQRVVLAAVSVQRLASAPARRRRRQSEGPAARRRAYVQCHAGGRPRRGEVASSPSDVSIIEVAPHSAAPDGGVRRRRHPLRADHSTGERNPRRSTPARPPPSPAARPTASTSPGRAPERVTGSAARAGRRAR